MAKQNLPLKRRIFLPILSFLLVFLCGALAYAQWTSVNPPFVSESWDLQRVHFGSSYDGWAVGWNYENHRGVLLHYSGGTWASVVPPSGVLDTRYLNGVHFTSPQEGWAVGWESWSNNHIILHYTGGEWTAVPSPNVHATAFYAVHFTSPDVGWAVGVGWDQKGIVARYAGDAWATFPVPYVSDDWYLRNVYFVSPDEGWAVGWDNEHQNGVILHYSGWVGGYGWTVVPLPALSGYLNDVYFTSANEGWIVGGGTLFHYTGGAWVADLPYGGNGVVFLSASEGWSVGGNGCEGLVTHYSGGAWSYDTVPDLNTCWTLLDVSFPSGGQGWAVGADSTAIKGVILRYALLEVTSPDKHDEWQRGKTYPIQWTYSGNPGSSVTIDLYKGGLKSGAIAEGVSIGSGGNGLYNWKIPSKQDPGSDYQVKVTVAGNELYNDMSARFAIVKTAVKPSITVKSPAGGESWKAGTAKAIEWEFTGSCGSNVKIDLLKDGSLDSVIATSVSIGTKGLAGGTGSFTWNIPSTQDPGSKYKVKVASKTRKDCQDTSDENFRITNPTLSPAITVISPNGGEHWLADTHQGIEWGFTGDPGSTVKIELLKGGVVQSTIATDVAVGKGGKGQYPWQIPSTQTPDSDYRIRVTSLTNGLWSDTSNGDFVINPALKSATITITTPNGGEKMYAGWIGDLPGLANIQWKYTGEPGSNVKIELLKGGVLNSVIAASVPIGSGGSGSYYWDTPVSQVAGTDYRIRITSTSNASYTDTSNGDFMIIAAPTITLTSPNGGESWQPGSTYTITWTYGGSLFSPPFNSIKIELLKGGALNSTIASDVSVGSGGSGSYSWTIPGGQSPGADYRVRLTYRFYNQISDTSNANFTIEPCFSPVSITVVSPNGGETWLRGTAHTIQWSYVGCPGPNVKIELLKAVPGAGPPIYETTLIVASTPIGGGGSGSYSWTIPSSPAPGLFYKIKITALPGGTLSDQSNNLFSITAIY